MCGEIYLKLFEEECCDCWLDIFCNVLPHNVCFDLFSICIMEYILIYLKKKKAAAAAAYIHIYNYSENNIAAAA